MSVWKTAGKVRMTPKGVWDSLTSYEILDTVVSEDLSTHYVAKQDVPVGTLLTNTDYWEVVVDVSDSVEMVDELLDNIPVVRVDEAQTFTDTQKATARGNIDAASTDEVSDLKNAFINSHYDVPLTWEEGSLNTSTGEEVESDKTRSDTYVQTTYGDELIKTSSTGMNIEYYDLENGSYVWKANAWASTGTTHEIRKQYGYFRITTNVKYSYRPYDTIFCYKYTGLYNDVKQLESLQTGVYVQPLYGANGKSVVWTQNASNTTLDLSAFNTDESFMFAARTSYKVTIQEILTAAQASEYVTVSNKTITGNNFAIVYNIDTDTVSITRGATEIKEANKRILFSIYYGSFVFGDIVDYEIHRRWESMTKRIDGLENVIDNDSVLPDYWLTYMQTKIRDVQAKDMAIGNHGDMFVFCTDQHFPTNDGHSPDLVDYVLRNSSVNTVIMGGDLIQGSNVSKQTGLNSLVDARNKYRTSNPRYLRGNHDSNTEISGRTPELAFTEDEVYAVLMKPVESEIKADGQMYYYFDNLEQKIRYICLDTGHPDTHVIEDAQITWMQDRISELQSGWTVVVITHQFFGTPPTKDGNGDKIEAGLDAIYDEVDAVIACVIAGHSHRDAYTTSAKGYPIIVTTCDLRGGEASSGTRTKGTTTEQAFDVFHIDTDPENRKIYATRIGFGEDREFSY